MLGPLGGVPKVDMVVSYAAMWGQARGDTPTPERQDRQDLRDFGARDVNLQGFSASFEAFYLSRSLTVPIACSVAPPTNPPRSIQGLGARAHAGRGWPGLLR